jgi:hypothetical protein
VVSVSQMIEEQLLYHPIQDLKISNERSNAVLSNASPAGLLAICSMWGGGG